MGTLDFLSQLEAPAATAISIPLDDIIPDPRQPRTAYREVDGGISIKAQTHIENLAGSIEDEGLLQPITVRDGEGEYEGKRIIIYGECRWRAFRLNRDKGIPGHDAIPAFIRNDMSVAKMRLAQLAENLNRDELPDIDVARFVKETLDENPELKKSELAVIMRKDNQYISRILALLNPKWADVVDSGMITYASLLEQYRALSEDSQKAVVSKVKAEGRTNITVTDIRSQKQVERASKGAKGAAHIDPFVASSVEKLLKDNTPEGENYRPPKSVYKDDGISQPVLPTTLEAAQPGFASLSRISLTARQLKVLMEHNAVTGKERDLTVELQVNPVDLKRMLKKIGGRVPENEALLHSAFMDKLNSV